MSGTFVHKGDLIMRLTVCFQDTAEVAKECQTCS